MKRFLALPVIHLLAHRYGWPSLKRRAFDAKYHAGAWQFDNEPDALVSLIHSHGQNGPYIMLGCGVNPQGRALARIAPGSTVHGCDVSPVAIERANAAAPAGHSFTVSDMETYRAPVPPMAVVFAESLYYVPTPRILPLLRYWQSQLLPGGVIVVTLAEPARWTELMAIIHAHCRVIHDEPVLPGMMRRVLVFR